MAKVRSYLSKGNNTAVKVEGGTATAVYLDDQGHFTPHGFDIKEPKGKIWYTGELYWIYKALETKVEVRHNDIRYNNEQIHFKDLEKLLGEEFPIILMRVDEYTKKNFIPLLQEHLMVDTIMNGFTSKIMEKLLPTKMNKHGLPKGQQPGDRSSVAQASTTQLQGTH